MTLLRRLVLTPMLVIAVTVCCAPAALAQTGRLAGLVKESGTGKPIKGATIVAENPQASPSSVTAISDEKGRFAMLGLRGGTWVLTVSAPDYVPTRGTTRVQSLGAAPTLEVRLEKAPPVPAGPLDGVDVKAVQRDLDRARDLIADARYDDALGLYRSILEKTPALTLARVEVARALRLKKDYAAARVACEEVLASEPQNQAARVQLALIELDRGDLDEADRLLTLAAADAGAGRDVLFELGEVKFAKADPDAAATWYRRAAEADPAWAPPLLKLALLAVNRGDTEMARQLLDKVRTLDPDGPDGTRAMQVLEQIKK